MTARAAPIDHIFNPPSTIELSRKRKRVNHDHEHVHHIHFANMVSGVPVNSTTLTSLPLEILMHVASYLPAPSVLPFALTSQKLHAASGDARRRQNFLYARYNLAVINCNLDPKDVDGQTCQNFDIGIVDADLDFADAPLSLTLPLSSQTGANSTTLNNNGSVLGTSQDDSEQTVAAEEDLGSHMPPNYFRSPITLLYHLRHNPDLTHHIRVVDFRASDNTTSSPLDSRLWAEYAAADVDGLLQDAAPWLGDEEDDHNMWRADIEGGNHGTALALLLSFLPNVKEVALTGLLHTYSCWLEMLVRGVNMMSQPGPGKPGSSIQLPTITASLPCPPLSKITTLNIEHLEPDNPNGPPLGPSGASLHSLLPLTQLPNIRYLTGRGIAGYDIFSAPVAAGIYKSQRSSPLHYVELNESAISPANLAKFVRPMKQLRRLTYEWGGEGVAGPRHVDMKQYGSEFVREAEAWLREEGFTVGINASDELEIRREHNLGCPESLPRR